MRKKSMFAAIAAIVAVSVAVGYSDQSGKYSRSNLAMANIEALTNEEDYSGKPCYNKGTYDISKPDVVVCGTPCKLEPTNLDWWQSTSKCQ